MSGRRRVDGNRSTPLRTESTPHGAPGPIRTCIGCRQRVTAAELFRVVVAPGPGGEPAPVVPDPHRRMPGRGAWLHPDPACVDLAVRRRAFGRALRATGTLDPSPVLEHVDALGEPDRQVRQNQQFEQDTTSGSPQEMTSYGHSMKRQQ